MPARPLPDRWTEDATWLAQAIDPRAGLIRLVRMDEAAYRDASFLDDRMLAAGLETRLAPLADAMDQASRAGRDDARWIFHIGHVGSTLIARLLGELDNVICLREPRSLRDLGFVPSEGRAAAAAGLRRMMSRTFREEQFALVKATSFVSELAPLLARDAPVLFLFASPGNYVSGILAGDNSVKELAALYEVRSERLRSRGIELVGYDRSNAHRAAAAWACEMTSLEAAFDATLAPNILWADFDIILEDMGEWLGRCARHFGFAAPPEKLREIVAGPLMRRYSKALEYDYSPSLRAELLDEAAALHRAEIADALSMLRRDAEQAPMLARALQRAEREG